jgi:hypothetical protein
VNDPNAESLRPPTQSSLDQSQGTEREDGTDYQEHDADREAQRPERSFSRAASPISAAGTIATSEPIVAPIAAIRAVRSALTAIIVDSYCLAHDPARIYPTVECAYGRE